MTRFEAEYQRLNSAQQQAVDNIDGPMLILAGPGTGKTQLLSMRVANIIGLTDTAPSNILCLTFTDNAARNMRERLETIIGQSAYHVSIHTFHSFGVDIINQYPDFFTDRQLIQQVDELGSYQLLREIFDDLPHSNPLAAKVGDDYIMLKDTLSIVSWLKQNALKPSELHKILLANKKFFDQIGQKVVKTFSQTVSPKQLKEYQSLLRIIKQYHGQSLFGFPAYETICYRELEQAIEATNVNSRYAPRITEWRNKWCEKNAKGEHVFKDAARNYRKMQAVANVYQQLIDKMASQGLYDFDDMIVEAVHAIETNRDLKSNLQERYQYILVDEFQDTNKAQLRLLTALGDNPLFENRPNIMAVGDDDQAIYAFQGAEVSNMLVFAKMYTKPALIYLSQNYRSSKDILDTSISIVDQINDRLSQILPKANKQLEVIEKPATGTVKHIVLPSELAQYDWVADQIKSFLTKGIKPEQIAVLAPRHKYLERLVPYLAKKSIPVAYERRENILDAPIVVQLLTIAHLITAIADNQQDEVNALLAEVISYDYWGISTEELLQISIDCFNGHEYWLLALLRHKNPVISSIANWFVDLSRQASTEPLEYILDNLMGVVAEGSDSEADEIEIQLQTKKLKFISPMRQHYFSSRQYEQSTDIYLSLLGQLSTLRQRLRGWQPNKTLYIKDLVDFAQLHKEARLKIIDTNPHTQTTNAVQVLTAYKAKGLEFEVVFIINAQDEIWGPTSRHRSLRVSLPKNLPIVPAGDDDNDKLRLLFVAFTRAKRDLIVTSYSYDLDNRVSPGLSFIGGNHEISESTPKKLAPQFISKSSDVEAIEILTTDWAYRFRQIIADKPTLFEPILKNYKLSVTHLNNFIDIVNGGPNYFFVHNFLRFPEALTPPEAYGDAVHRTLQWLHGQYRQAGKLPNIKKAQDYFTDMLSRKHLRSTNFKRLNDRGRLALSKYLKERGSSWDIQDLIERGFNNEGVVINGASLSGKIDKIHFNGQGRAWVTDFKTGKPAVDWKGRDEIEKIKLHKYKQQLLFYKLLVENSATYAKKIKIEQAGLEFIEAGEDGRLVDNLMHEIADKELADFVKLITSIWQHIITLDMPAIDKYPKTLKGILAFEEDLINSKI